MQERLGHHKGCRLCHTGPPLPALQHFLCGYKPRKGRCSRSAHPQRTAHCSNGKHPAAGLTSYLTCAVCPAGHCAVAASPREGAGARAPVCGACLGNHAAAVSIGSNGDWAGANPRVLAADPPDSRSRDGSGACAHAAQPQQLRTEHGGVRRPRRKYGGLPAARCSSCACARAPSAAEQTW